MYAPTYMYGKFKFDLTSFFFRINQNYTTNHIEATNVCLLKIYCVRKIMWLYRFVRYFFFWLFQSELKCLETWILEFKYKFIRLNKT